eukprot:TRINITY_DN23762_c0_g1_i1.p1 TRINITY_DN23762_c0_g1~~TRINITY_DN23762_c0_g1_i1.p1  ORF type:complete len:211 (+),score=61.69 TRINITY_DN23762_c0_g1_i1:54-635(+)
MVSVIATVMALALLAPALADEAPVDGVVGALLEQLPTDARVMMVIGEGFESGDADHDGELTQEEVVDMLQKRDTVSDEDSLMEEVQNGFELYDLDKDGLLSMAEFVEMLNDGAEYEDAVEHGSAVQAEGNRDAAQSLDEVVDLSADDEEEDLDYAETVDIEGSEPEGLIVSDDDEQDAVLADQWTEGDEAFRA